MAKQTPQPKASKGSARVICRLENAGDSISGIDFGLLDLGERMPVRVSDAIDPALAERMCGVEGFAPFDGDDDAAATAVEEARKSRIATRPSGSGERQIAELRRANEALSGEILAANRRIAELEAGAPAGGAGADPAELEALKGQLAERDATIQVLQTQAAERDSYIANLEEQLRKPAPEPQ